MEERPHLAVVSDVNEALKPPRSPPARATIPVHENLGTYIVQIPRDQIYRIPPPENSKIVESYRTLPAKKKKGCACGWWIGAPIIVLLLLAIICGITFAIIKTVNKPRAPTISIAKIHVKNATTRGSKHSNFKYEILLKVKNPNKRMRVSYGDEGETSVSYNDDVIGKGKYPIASQDAKDLTNVQLTLNGTKSLPNVVEKSMKEKQAKTPVELSLDISVPIKIKGFLVLSYTKTLKIVCDFKVNSLGAGSKVSSQDCSSEI